MAQEIERKYLVDTSLFDTKLGGLYTISGYLDTKNQGISQIRIAHCLSKGKGYINIKGNRSTSSRLEVESNIHVSEAEKLLDLIPDNQKIYKKRIKSSFQNNDWSVDVYDGNNKGLVIAEIEIPHEEYEYSLPNWVTIDVTNDDSFYNVNLVKHPWNTWSINKTNNNTKKVDNFRFDSIFSALETVRIIPFSKLAWKLFGEMKPLIGFVAKESSPGQLCLRVGKDNRKIIITRDIIESNPMIFTIDSLDFEIDKTPYLKIVRGEIKFGNEHGENYEI